MSVFQFSIAINRNISNRPQTYTLSLIAIAAKSRTQFLISQNLSSNEETVGGVRCWASFQVLIQRPSSSNFVEKHFHGALATENDCMAEALEPKTTKMIELTHPKPETCKNSSSDASQHKLTGFSRNFAAI